MLMTYRMKDKLSEDFVTSGVSAVAPITAQCPEPPGPQLLTRTTVCSTHSITAALQ
jgi:hypothetical protein